MENVKKKPVLQHIRSLELNQSVELPRTQMSAINSAIVYLTSTYTRKFTRILTEDKTNYTVTRIA